MCRLTFQMSLASTSIHEVPCALFRKVKANVETLPPTQDALSLHLTRAHYQTTVWKQSLETHPQLPSPTSYGWHMKDGMLVPHLTKAPVQARCFGLTICGCIESGSAVTGSVDVEKSGIFCSGVCGCACAACCKNTQVFTSLLLLVLPHYMQLYCFRLFRIYIIGRYCFSCFVDLYYAFGVMHVLY